MMLATRIIPTLLCRGRQLVKGQQFNSWRSVGLAAQAVRIHQARGVDELILLDIEATPEGRGPDLDLIRELSEVLFCPLTVGGGVRSIDDVHALLEAGADKVSIGRHALLPGGQKFINDIAHRFGSQAIVVSVDGTRFDDGHKILRYTLRGNASDPEAWVWSLPADWARKMEDSGAGEILLTSMDREGTMQGYDLDLIRGVSNAVSIPVIAHGGCKDYEDMYQAVQAGASAVAAGALFQFTDMTPRGAAEYLSAKGIEVRL